MRKLITQLIKAVPLLAFMLSFTLVNAQRTYETDAPTWDFAPEDLFNLTIRNVAQTSDRILEFDVFLLDMDAAQPMEVATTQGGLTYNTAILNAGTLAGTIIAGTSDFPSTQGFASINTATAGQVKLSTKSPPGSGAGFICSAAGNGSRIARIRLTCTQPFTTNSTANLFFAPSTGTNPYPSKIALYLASNGAQNTQIPTIMGDNCFVYGNPNLNAPTPTQWTGTVNNLWTEPGNWTEGVPVVGSEVTIAPAINQPTISTFVSLFKLTINSGASVTIAPTGQVTVTNTLTNNAGATGIVVKSGGSLITGGAVTGMATVESSLTGGNWHLISSPVSGAFSGMFLGKYLQAHSEGSNTYSDIELPTASLTPMKGFAVFNGTGFTASYVGSLNTGAVSANLTRSQMGANSGWNLLGNPYPSSIDWNAATGWTKTNVTGATYIHATMSTWASFVAGVGANGGSQFIAPGQGFFVQVTDGPTTGVLGMTNSVRVHNAAPFFKSEVTNLVRLAVSGNDYTDEAVVRILPEATTDFDGDYDAVKLFGEVAEAAQLYSLGSSELAINSTPSTNPVQVGMRAGASGRYTITATEVNDLAYVTLEDTKTGKFTNLKSGSYSFEFVAGENEQRFVLHFDQLPVNSNNSIYAVKSTVHVDLQNAGDIFIYSVSGQLVAKAKGNVGENTFNLTNTGNYIVKVVFTEATPLTKKVSVL